MASEQSTPEPYCVALWPHTNRSGGLYLRGTSRNRGFTPTIRHLREQREVNRTVCDHKHRTPIHFENRSYHRSTEETFGVSSWRLSEHAIQHCYNTNKVVFNPDHTRRGEFYTTNQDTKSWHIKPQHSLNHTWWGRIWYSPLGGAVATESTLRRWLYTT